MRYLIAALALLIALAACAQEAPVCTAPYIADGASCCLDKDADGACDAPAADEASAASCDLCPPKFVTQKEEVIVYKYVCMNGSIMAQATDCEARIASNAHLFSPATEQDPAHIDAFEARPACRGEYAAAEIHLVVPRAPQQVVFQAQDDPQGAFRDIGALDGSKVMIDDEYFYLGFCESIDCESVTDAKLPATGAALVRAVLTYQDGKVYTRDLLLDPTPDGEYGKRRC